MKTFLKVFFLFSLTYLSNSKGYTHIYDQKVASQPLIVKYDPNNIDIHVICAGIDLNFNGKFDEGDQKPSWWIIPKPGVTLPDQEVLDSTKLMMEFEMGSLNFPLRAFFKFDYMLNEGYLMISIHDTLKSFSLKNGKEVFQDCGIYKALDFFVDGNIIYSVTANKEIKIVNTQNFFSIDTVKLSRRPNGILKILKEDTTYLAVLFEGDFGKSNASLQFFKQNEKSWDSIKTLEVGASANHFIKDSNYIYIALNGSHEVKVINIKDLEIFTSVNLGTNFYDGPRELILNDNYVYVTTYAGDIRKINKTDMELESIYESNNKLEGIDFINDDYIVAAGPFKKDSYMTDSTVAFFSSLLDVYEKNNNNFKIVETNNLFEISYTDLINSIEIYNSYGDLILTKNNVNSLNCIMDKQQFISGVYFIKIKSNNKIITNKIAIIN